MPKSAGLTAKILIAVAIALGVGVAGSAPTDADPSAFSTLSCSCGAAAPAGSPVRKDAIAKGIRQGLSDLSPGPGHQLSS
jgi:hypothetical protein